MIILIDKPKEITSFDVIRKLRKEPQFAERREKMGHSGTLDPIATGLMIIATGKDTKKLKDYLKLPKTYEAKIILGIKTDSGDISGKILEEREINRSPDYENLKKALNAMHGALKLKIPAYSAVKRKGKPLYKYARAGKIPLPELPEKEMKIYSIKLTSHKKEKSYYLINIKLDVSSGTYVRSVAEEIGRKLGLPATVKELRRTRIGNFKVEDARKI